MRKRANLTPPPGLELSFGGDEHRQYPRAEVAVKFALWIGEGAERRFSASVTSNDLSVGGAFLESTFFVPVGTRVRTSFRPVLEEEPVQAEGEIVREERHGKRNGFAIRFTEFFDQTEVTLAKLFVSAQLRHFCEDYLESKRLQDIDGELERMVDTLAAWELTKITSPENNWGLVRKPR